MKYVLEGDPIAQTRMRFSSFRGMSKVYDPRAKEKKEFKKRIQKIHGSNTFFINPRVSFIFHMPIPRSIPTKFLQLYQSGFLKHTKKPDTDNLIKLYLDCMDDICFQGDQKVSLGPCLKLYHPHPKTIIILQETEAIISPLEVDPMTWYAF